MKEENKIIESINSKNIELNKNQVYVSFEGTDHLIGGWKEDFMMSYMFPIPSQKMAISYVNRKFTFVRKQIIFNIFRHIKKNT